jgi:hypothetical protein
VGVQKATIRLEDSPGQPPRFESAKDGLKEADKIKVKDKFMTYITRTPKGGKQVTMATVAWGWEGEAKRNVQSDCGYQLVSGKPDDPDPKILESVVDYKEPAEEAKPEAKWANGSGLEEKEEK